MPPPNSSSTGGFLAPTSRGGVRTDLELENLIHDWIVGLTAMDPPPIPDFAVTWCAFYITRTVSDWDPVVEHWSDNVRHGDTVFRNQRIELTLTFYGPASGDLALDFRMASGIRQNEELLDYDVKLVSVEDQVTTSEVIKGRWQRRVDVPVVLRRAVQFTYAVEDVAGAYGSVYSDAPQIDWLVEPS
jgi:hypothetical protein